MEERRRGGFVWGLRWLWRVVDGARRLAVNLLFVLLLVLLVAALLADGSPTVADRSALLLKPSGQLVEQLALSEPLALLRGGAAPEQSRLHDLVEAVDGARGDARIRALVLETDALEGAGLAKLQELGEAIDRFRDAGKPVLAWGSRFSQAQYFLASRADELYMAPDGFVLLQGFASYPTYYKGLLDRLGVKMQVFRVGDYKSAVEPFTRDGMSPEDREATARMLHGMWQQWLEAVARSRRLGVEDLARLVADYPARVAASGGDAAALAQQARLVDGLLTRDQWFELLKERFGGDDEEPLRPRLSAFADYLGALRAGEPAAEAVVAVVVVQGAIVDGEQPPGVAGGETVARLLREVREDDAVKALVLRVDSPGGSVFASERIRREVELVRQAGKPVVASMSSVAASGGYWVASAAQELWAGAGTLTGSIGIFAMFPDLSGPMERLGLSVDGVGTAPAAGALDPRRPLPPALAAGLQSSVEHGYRRFVELVARARGLSHEAVDEVARGQVWTGAQAQPAGLVDHLGGFREALDAAARRAGLDDFRVRWVEPRLSARDQIVERLLGARVGTDAPRGDSPVGWLARALIGELRALEHWNDPGHAYAHCLCGSP